MSAPVKIAVVAYHGFNELDLFANLHILNRVTRVRPDLDLSAELVGPAARLRSMFGVDVATAGSLASVGDADAVVVGSGGTLDAIEDEAFMAALSRLDPARQVIGSQCSGALVLHRLGLLGDHTACTDDSFRPLLEDAGVTVLDQPFVAHGNLGTSGGCLASAHLSAWMLSRLVGPDAAADTLATVAPVGEVDTYVPAVMAAITADASASDRP